MSGVKTGNIAELIVDGTRMPSVQKYLPRSTFVGHAKCEHQRNSSDGPGSLRDKETRASLCLPPSTLAKVERNTVMGDWVVYRQIHWIVAAGHFREYLEEHGFPVSEELKSIHEDLCLEWDYYK